MITRIARTAGFSGLLAALLLTLLQSLWVSPLILKAETYEDTQPAAHHDHEGQATAPHVHDDEAWTPADGWQRVLSTLASNLVVAVGFALILAALYSLREPHRIATGALWGLSGFAVFCLAPMLGLPPELPGTAAAELGQRQAWWIGTAGATAVGLALLVFARAGWVKLLGAALLIVPHVLGAPQPEVHQSLAPPALESQFILASGLTNAAFWLALGTLSTWLYRRIGQA
ncbi:CbtA family protein [Pseudomonas capeferrum]|uniref:CbtA family protein n=1 Tax=Pseudomonas capeferrum TaxID=1495066 RepID=UPI0015E3C8F0|nr:CbtA family protein [Pseudomonas capeferrum]MBA1202689.1 CbtA family protein [Pseudomonas capeferrum]